MDDDVVRVNRQRHEDEVLSIALRDVSRREPDAAANNRRAASLNRSPHCLLSLHGANLHDSHRTQVSIIMEDLQTSSI